MWNIINHYIDNVMQMGEEIDLKSFAIRLHNAFYQHLDLSYLDDYFYFHNPYFDGQFVVPHSKLVQYGITGTKGIKKRLKNIGMVEGKDFICRNISSMRKSKPSCVYYLTCDSFLLCLNLTIENRFIQEYFAFLRKVEIAYLRYRVQILETSREPFDFMLDVNEF